MSQTTPLPADNIPQALIAEAEAAILARPDNLNAHGYDAPPGNTPNAREVATCIAFLRALEPRYIRRYAKGVNRMHTSYGWKHDAERWGKHVGYEPYIANGAFITAALYEGVRVTRARAPTSPNALVGLWATREGSKLFFALANHERGGTDCPVPLGART